MELTENLHLFSQNPQASFADENGVLRPFRIDRENYFQGRVIGITLRVHLTLQAIRSLRLRCISPRMGTSTGGCLPLVWSTSLSMPSATSSEHS